MVGLGLILDSCCYLGGGSCGSRILCGCVLDNSSLVGLPVCLLCGVVMGLVVSLFIRVGVSCGTLGVCCTDMMG